ncbi:MAG: TonB-dependent receptor plug domain-containing protein, partial [Spirosoma sp.]|nr:TonB-dependent receptor plug domain-containing protein [Spirosoma sp.]
VLQPNEPTASVASSISKADVQFMPEGGHLVAGFDGRVAFKAVGANGCGQTVEGFVLNSQKDTVIGFASTHLGMGTFGFKPEAGQTYTAFVKQTNGGFTTYPLPAVLPQGAVLQADNLSNKDNLKVYVQHNRTSADPNATLTLLAQTRGQVIQAAKIPLSRKTGVVQLPKKQFPEGIAQLTLFDETNQPVCERLVFIDHNDRINVRIEPSKATYHPRQKVELTITTTDADGKPLIANLSLAAVDDRLSPNLDSNRATITSHLLLSSDLTGTVEQPAYYFDPLNTDRAAKLDLLLMTQGWRRFVWSDVLAGTPPPIRFPVERGLSLTGQVRKPNQKDIGGVVKLNFILTKKDTTGTTPRRLFLMGDTDEQGNFGAFDLDFTDTTTVLIQGTKGRANRDLVISLDQLLTPRVTLVQPPYNPVEFNADEYAEFIRRTDEYMAIERQIRNNREVLLKAVTVKAKKYVETDSRKIYSNPDATVKFDQLNTSGRQNILEVIQSRIAGVQVTGSGFSAKVQIRGAANFGGAIEPLFVIDGMPTDLQGALSISVQDVDLVDVLKGASAAIYGSRAAGGVISILTKRGSPNYEATKEAAPGTLVAKLPGYLPVKEFYAPRYDQKLPDGADKPDYRTTLFWTPAIQTGADGKATVSFFTSDARNPVRIQVEGANIIGMPGVGKQTVRVE